MTSALKYPGAKWAIANWIIDLFPEHHSYLEPFFGSGAVLFRKSQSNIETVNDLDDEIINLFECIRNDPEKMAWLICMTPYARQEYENAYICHSSERYQKARAFFIRCNMGHGFRVNGEKVGWKNDVQGREKAYAVKFWNKVPEQILAIAERLKEVQIEHRPACELIKRFNYPNVLIYADPPYMLNTRHGKQYRHEMNMLDHEELIEVLKLHKGYVMISGYDTDMYNSLLKGWHKEKKISYTQTMTQKIEILWMNFMPSGQMSFDI